MPPFGFSLAQACEPETGSGRKPGSAPGIPYPVLFGIECPDRVDFFNVIVIMCFFQQKMEDSVLHCHPGRESAAV
jgi:hypothetical protein